MEEKENKIQNKIVKETFSQADISQLVIDTTRGHTNTTVKTSNKIASPENYKQLAKLNLETSQNLIILSLINTPSDKVLDVMEEYFIQPKIDEKVKKANAKIDPDKISHKTKKGVKGMGME